jgi:DNA-binding transcriptional LysR family regulator
MQYGEMDNEVRKLTGDVLGPLVIGASTTIGQYVIPRVLGDYQAKFPEVTMRLYVTNTLGVIHMVENNEIDVVLLKVRSITRIWPLKSAGRMNCYW